MKKKNANSICVSRAVLNSHKCASGKTDRRCILADSTNLLRPCLVGSSFEAASVLGLRFWQMQRGIGSSLYLHIHTPKNLPRLSLGKIFWFTDVQTQA